jgi:hypothetical protein
MASKPIGLVRGATFVAIVGAVASCTLVTDLNGLSGAPFSDAGTADVTSPPPSDGSAEGAPADTGADAPTSTYRAAVLADGPVSYLRLGASTGTAAPDESGLGNFGVLSGTFEWSYPGALKGDPDTALLTSEAALDFARAFDATGMHPFSLEAWIKTEIIDTVYRTLFDQMATISAKRQGYTVFLEENQVVFERRVDDVQLTARAPAATFIGRWVHIVCAYDGSALNLYVDGVLASSQPDARLQPPTSATLLVAADEKIAGTFHGGLDEVAIYDKALAPARVKAHFGAANGL